MKKRNVDSINDFLSSVEQEPYLVCISGEGTKQGEGGTHGALLTHGVLVTHGTNVANPATIVLAHMRPLVVHMGPF